jgi:Tfp pilus assembly protein PilZ
VAARAEIRFRKRIPCKLTRSKNTFSGLVLDFSRTGLFVQTSATAKAGEEIEIMLGGHDQAPDIVLNAQVVWQRRVPLQLRSTVQGGVGVQIRYASESYYSLLAEAADSSGPTRARLA